MDRDAELHMWREEAREAYHARTGLEMTDRRYLEPRARQIWDKVHHESSVVRGRIYVSPRVLEIVRDILIERGEDVRSGIYDGWHGVQSGVVRLEEGDPPPF